MDEYVPTRTPMNRARAKSARIGPPKIMSADTAMRVVTDVSRVRDSVSLRETLMTSLRSRLGKRRRFSRILESLLPGDYAEVDRGFLIDKICARLGIIVVRPNVNRNGQKQISLGRNIGKALFLRRPEFESTGLGLILRETIFLENNSYLSLRVSDS